MMVDPDGGAGSAFRSDWELSSAYTHAVHQSAETNARHKEGVGDDIRRNIDDLWLKIHDLLGHDNQSTITEILVRPMVGDYTKIANNGVAWSHAASQFDHLRKNLDANSVVLTEQFWRAGPARDEFRNHINNHWTPALITAWHVADYIGKGFTKLADCVRRVTVEVIGLIDDLIDFLWNMIGKKLAKSWVLDTGTRLFSWAKSGFDDYPYEEEINQAKRMIQAIKNVHEKVRSLINSMRRLINVAHKMMDAAGNIPDIAKNGSNSQAYDAATELNQGATDTYMTMDDIKKDSGDLNKELRKMDDSSKSSDQDDRRKKGRHR